MPISEHLQGPGEVINRSLPFAEVKANTRNNDPAMTYTTLPEFAEELSSDVTLVDASRYAVGQKTQKFTSRFVLACSGFVIRDPSNVAFGLYHASPLPFLDLSGSDFKTLAIFAEGEAMELRGSESTPKDHILRQLKNRLGINHAGTIEIPTIDANMTNHFFHIAFRPGNSEVLVARNSHRDVVRYPIFQ